MNDHEFDIMETLGEIKGLAEGTKVAVEGLRREMLATFDGNNATHTAIADRVGKLEREHDFQTWYNICIVPVVGVLHAIARKLGVQI